MPPHVYETKREDGGREQGTLHHRERKLRIVPRCHTLTRTLRGYHRRRAYRSQDDGSVSISPIRVDRVSGNEHEGGNERRKR